MSPRRDNHNNEERLSNAAQHSTLFTMAHNLSAKLVPSISPPPPAAPSRDSTLESAGQAADIFDLYGANEESMRGSWEGPMDALHEDRDAGQEQLDPLSGTTPNINIITSPPAPPSPSHSQSPAHSRPHTPIKHRFPSIRSTRTDSTTNSPVPYNDIQRLSPANTSSKRGSMSTEIFSGTDGTRSQTSIAASSRYPGEEEDAFHVRSTCTSSLSTCTCQDIDLFPFCRRKIRQRRCPWGWMGSRRGEDERWADNG